jgi:hypothetical protein
VQTPLMFCIRTRSSAWRTLNWPNAFSPCVRDLVRWSANMRH